MTQSTLSQHPIVDKGKIEMDCLKSIQNLAQPSFESHMFECQGWVVTIRKTVEHLMIAVSTDLIWRRTVGNQEGDLA
jgi:hypothetical protein